MQYSKSKNTNLGTFPPVMSPEVYPLLNRMTALGLQVEYSFPRTESLVSKSVTVRLRFKNFLQAPITDIKMTCDDALVRCCDAISSLGDSATQQANTYIDFKDKMQPVKFTISTSKGSFPCSLAPRIGELLLPLSLSEDEFESRKNKLGGMHENQRKFPLSSPLTSLSQIDQAVWSVAHVSRVGGSNDPNTGLVMWYAARTVHGGVSVLLTVRVPGGGTECRCSVNTESMLLGVVLLDDVKQALVGVA